VSKLDSIPFALKWTISYLISAILGFVLFGILVIVVGTILLAYLSANSLGTTEYGLSLIAKLYWTLIPFGIFFFLTFLNYSQMKLLKRIFSIDANLFNWGTFLNLIMVVVFAPLIWFLSLSLNSLEEFTIIKNLIVSLVFFLSLLIVSIWQWSQIKSKGNRSYYWILVNFLLGIGTALYINFDYLHLLLILTIIMYAILPTIVINNIKGKAKVMPN